MITNSLIVRDDAARSLEFTSAALALRDDALSLGALIGTVDNAEHQDRAVSAQREIARVLQLCEQARKSCKEPIIEFGRLIDSRAKTFVEPLEAEKFRLGKLVGNFQALEQAKQRAAEKARMEEITKLEREREAAIAQAKSHEEIEKIQAQACEEAKNIPVYQAPKAEGQSVRMVWVIDQIREFELVKARPDLVRKIEFDMNAIKAALKAGMKLPGVTAHEEVDSSVRAGRSPALINV